MMAPYFIYAFIFLELFIQGLLALEFSSVALIYPQRSDVTVDAGSDLTLGCRGAEPMRWAFQDDVNGRVCLSLQHFNTSQKNITYMYNENELEYKHETLLTIYNMSYENIGFYYCHGVAVDFSTPRRSSRIYVFVYDETHLSVSFGAYKFVDAIWFTFVPCRPTAQDINITVTCGRYSDVTMSVNPGNYTTLIQDETENYVGKFHPYHGFEFQYQEIAPWLPSCHCNFTRNNVKSNFQLAHSNTGAFAYSGVSIASPATADVGSDLTLQCAYLGPHYFPYSKFWPQWKLPASRNKYTEIIEVIKLETYVLVINIIRMNNISNEDEGDYECMLNSGNRKSSASAYVYINDKKSNNSAPQIYSSTGDEIQINAGANITLRCASSQPVTWTRNQVQKTYKIEHISNVGMRYETYLHLTEASYEDVGLYHCYENGSTWNHPFHSTRIYMYVKDAHNLYVPQTKQYFVYPYSNATVPCLPTSRDVNVSLSVLRSTFNYKIWRYSPYQMINPFIYAYDPREGFAVQMPGPDHAKATVTCTFTTETARATLDIEYDITKLDDYVESEPRITGPHEHLVFFGQTLELSCTVFVRYHIPDNALHWIAPNNVTSNETIVERRRVDWVAGKVLISKLIVHDVEDKNAGRYFCYSIYHNATASKYISVYDQFAVRKPLIEILQYDYAYIGQPLVLRCKVTANHNVGFRMSWTTPDDTEIQNSNIEYIPTIRNISGEIIFKLANTTYENEGNYSCDVFYSTESRNYTTKYILVKRGKKPKIVTSNFKNQEEIIVQVDDTVNLTCYAKGDPKPVITWMKGSTEVQRLGEHIGFAADNSELTIYYVQRIDAGLYTCIAQNIFGRDSRAVNLSLKTVSFMPYIGAVIFVFILGVVVPVILARRSCKQKKYRNELNKAAFGKIKSGELRHFNPYITEQVMLLPYDTKWEIPRNNIELGCNLGSGYFGLVVKATVSNFFDGEPEKTVAVKMAHRNCNIMELNSLICELKIMANLGEHVNLINLLGACADKIAEGNLLVVIEYCDHGSLKTYLMENRCHFVNLIDPDTELIRFPDDDRNSVQDVEKCGDTTKPSELNTLQLLRWAQQVAHGMEFLASKQILHGDLAVRNILLSKNFVVKISDFGLSKTLSSCGYYKKSSQCPLPVKWMAIESIRFKTFSTQSDVWAFGVVLWELFSLARTPYAELEPDFRFYRKLESGYRLERPDYSTKEIYQVMRECWCERPQSRPTFSCLVQTLTDLLQDPKERCSAKDNASDQRAAVRVLVAGHADTDTPDWVALDILPSSCAENVTETRLVV